MINHLSVGVRDIAAARRFYDAALSPLDYDVEQLDLWEEAVIRHFRTT